MKPVEQVQALARRLCVSERVLLDHFFERAAIRHYDGGMERDEADRAAVDDINNIYDKKAI